VNGRPFRCRGPTLRCPEQHAGGPADKRFPHLDVRTFAAWRVVKATGRLMAQSHIDLLTTKKHAASFATPSLDLAYAESLFSINRGSGDPPYIILQFLGRPTPF
jgi:hypothetical protein